jgi:hypothetical protein
MDIELMDPPSLGGLAQAEPAVPVAPQADPVKQASEPLSIVDVATKKYMEEKAAILRQQQALLDSLQERSRPSGADLLLSMGSGFLAPTRSGSFGESLGNVGNQVSQYRENQKKNAGDLAKMRLEMGMQQLGMTKEDIGLAKEQQALKLIASVFNTDPKTVSTSLASGTVPGGDLSKITPALYAAVSQSSPALGKVLEGAYNMDIKRREREVADKSENRQQRELDAKLGFVGNSSDSAGLKRNDKGVVVGSVPSEEAGERIALALNDLGIPHNFSVNAPDDLSGLPLVDQNRIRAERVARAEEEFKPFRESILASNPSVTSSRDRSLRELMTILDQNKTNVSKGGTDIFGLLQKQGVVSSLYQAAEEGVRTPGGGFSLPAEKFLRNLQIPTELRPMLTRATQILADQFLLNARANKGVLGSQVSNFDAQMMQLPMATPADSSRVIEYWTKLNMLGNKERAETFDAYSKFSPQQKHQFVNSSEYKRIISDYNKFYDQFTQKYPITTESSAASEVPKKTDFTGQAGRFITNMVRP